MEVLQRRCSRCHLVKMASEFSRKGSDLLVSHCRECNAVYHRQRYRQNKEAYVLRRDEYRDRLKAIMHAAKAAPCADCGKSYPTYVMDLDHWPGEIKVGTLSELIHSRGISIEKALAEIAKCDVVCANCHRERTQCRLMRAMSSENQQRQEISETEK